jgi:hypothetical protein
MRILTVIAVLLSASPTFGDQPDIQAIVETHVIPRYQTLEIETAELSKSAAANCSTQNPDLITAYHNAFDAWIRVSHLRFGPSEAEDRAFALAFWPDPRGSTPKALSALISAQDRAASNAEDFAAVSVAARGFYALEFLIFDPQFETKDNLDYKCELVQAVTKDIYRNSADILADWESSYGDLMAKADNDTYRSPTEAAQQFFTSLSTGLEFTSQTRLGRPMGTFDRPRPKRAEARRSERSLRNVVLSLSANRELAQLITAGNPEVDKAFQTALGRAEALGDPIFAGVAEPQGRFKVEVLQQSIDAIREILAQDVGPSLGIAAGFNSLDGD